MYFVCNYCANDCKILNVYTTQDTAVSAKNLTFVDTNFKQNAGMHINCPQVAATSSVSILDSLTSFIALVKKF